MGKYKKYIWTVGLCCALPLAVSGQQVEPLTGGERLFHEGRELFLRQDYAAARLPGSSSGITLPQPGAGAHCCQLLFGREIHGDHCHAEGV